MRAVGADEGEGSLLALMTFLEKETGAVGRADDAVEGNAGARASWLPKWQ